MFTQMLDRLEAKVLTRLRAGRELGVQLDITNYCNLSCTHCYHSNHKNSGAISISQWQSIIEQISNFCARLNFRPLFILCGGEPLLSPLLAPMMNLLESNFQSPSFTILTNGTVVHDKHLRLFGGKNVSIQVSVDGPDARRHDAVRGEGSFELSQAGIRRLMGAGLSVSILSILSERTAPWIPEFFETASKLGVKSQNFTRLISQGFGAEMISKNIDKPLEASQLKKAFSDIILFSDVFKVSTATNQPLFCLLGEQYGQNGQFGVGSLIVDYKGQLKVSSRSEHVLGSLLVDDLETLFLTHPIMKALQSGEIEGCGTCRYYKRCGGDRNASFATHGSFFKKDPGCWV